MVEFGKIGSNFIQSDGNCVFREEANLGRKLSENLLQNEGHAAEEERDRGEGDEGIKGEEEDDGFERSAESGKEKKRRKRRGGTPRHEGNNSKHVEL